MKEKKETGDSKMECDSFVANSFHSSGKKILKKENIGWKLGLFSFIYILSLRGCGNASQTWWQQVQGFETVKLEGQKHYDTYNREQKGLSGKK